MPGESFFPQAGAFGEGGVREPGTGDWAQRSELPVVHCNISLAPSWPALGAKGVVQCSTSSAPQ